MQMPETYCHSTEQLCATQFLAFWISGVLWDSVVTDGLFSPFELWETGVCPQRVSL